MLHVLKLFAMGEERIARQHYTQQSISLIYRAIRFYPNIVFRHPFAANQSCLPGVTRFRINFGHLITVVYPKRVSKLVLLIILAGVIAALVIGGVLEIKFHPENLSRVPGAIMQYFKDYQIIEQGRVLFTRTKRFVEGYLIRDPEQQRKVALQYAKADAERLKQLIEQGKTLPQDLEPQTKLLASSLEKVKSIADNLTGEKLIEFQKEAGDTLKNVQENLAALQKLQAAYEQSRDRFASLAKSLQDGLARVNLGLTSKPNPSPTPSSKPSSSSTPIPLQF